MAFVYVVLTETGSIHGTYGARKRARKEARAYVVEGAHGIEDIEVEHDEGVSLYSDRGQNSERRTADVFRCELE